MLTFRKNYFLLTLLLFAVEVYIAVFVHDNIIRPYIGDLLVVMLVYCFVRSFFTVSVNWSAAASLLFAYLVEYLQYINFVDRIGLSHSKLANTVIGNSFAWMDMLAYTAGILLTLITEWLIARSSFHHGESESK